MSVAAAQWPQPEWLGCESCGLATANAFRHSGEVPGRIQRCGRCGHALQATKPYAVQRTSACVVAAAVLYVPANVLPIMLTTSALQKGEHTLLGGIHELWIGGSWGLAIIVFIASIAVPVLKIGVLALLATWSFDPRLIWRGASEHAVAHSDSPVSATTVAAR